MQMSEDSVSMSRLCREVYDDSCYYFRCGTENGPVKLVGEKTEHGHYNGISSWRVYLHCAASVLVTIDC